MGGCEWEAVVRVGGCFVRALQHPSTQSDSLFIAVSKHRDAKHLDVDVTLLQAMAMEGVLVRDCFLSAPLST